MKVTIEPTVHMVTVNGVPARVWEGHTAQGVPLYLLAVRVAVHQEHDHAALQAVLREASPPSPEAEAAFPIRMIL